MVDEMKVEDGQVVSMDYVLTVEGEVFDHSEKDEPLEFIQGEGHIIAGLEQAIYGMAIGESRQVVVAPADGYGEQDGDAFIEVPRAEFPTQIPLEPGLELQVRSEDGDELPARIDSISDDSIRLDFNHPLAGKELHFDVKIVSLRPASSEELEHGHVHGEHDHEHGEHDHEHGEHHHGDH